MDMHVSNIRSLARSEAAEALAADANIIKVGNQTYKHT